MPKPRVRKRPLSPTNRAFSSLSVRALKLVAIFLMKVFDLYQLKKQKAAPLTTQDIVFTKLDPTSGVKVIFIQFKVT